MRYRFLFMQLASQLISMVDLGFGSGQNPKIKEVSGTLCQQSHVCSQQSHALLRQARDPFRGGLAFPEFPNRYGLSFNIE